MFDTNHKMVSFQNGDTRGEPPPCPHPSDAAVNKTILLACRAAELDPSIFAGAGNCNRECGAGASKKNLQSPDPTFL